MAVSMPLRIPRDRMVSATKFSKRVGGYLDSVKEEPLFVVRGDSVRAVIVDINEYEYLHELAEAIEDLMLADVARERLEKLVLGQTQLIPFEEVLKQENIPLDEIDVRTEGRVYEKAHQRLERYREALKMLKEAALSGDQELYDSISKRLRIRPFDEK